MISIYETLITNSLYALAIAGLILLVQLVLKRNLSAKWKFALWGCFLIKLMVPVSFFPVLPNVSLGGETTYITFDETKSHLVSKKTPVKDHLKEVDGALAVEKVTALSEKEVSNNKSLMNESQESTGEQNESASFWPYSFQELVFFVIAFLQFFWLLFLIKSHWRFNHLIKSSILLKDVMTVGQDEIEAIDRVYLHKDVSSPMLVGLFSPRIILPEDLISHLEVSEINCIVLHELTHIKRKDHWVNYVMNILNIVYCVNPLIFFLSKKIRQDMEMACDEQVVDQNKNLSTKSYSGTLIKVLEKSMFKYSPQPALQFLGSKHFLKKRLVNILDDNRHFKVKGLGLIMFLLFSVFIFAGQSDPYEKILESSLTNADSKELVNFLRKNLPVNVIGNIIPYGKGKYSIESKGISVNNFLELLKEKYKIHYTIHENKLFLSNRSLLDNYFKKSLSQDLVKVIPKELLKKKVSIHISDSNINLSALFDTFGVKVEYLMIQKINKRSRSTTRFMQYVDIKLKNANLIDVLQSISLYVDFVPSYRFKGKKILVYSQLNLDELYYQKMKESLGKKQAYEIKNLRFHDVIDYFREKNPSLFVMTDKRGLENKIPQTKINLTKSKLTGREFLNSIFRKTAITFWLEDEVIIISSKLSKKKFKIRKQIDEIVSNPSDLIISEYLKINWKKKGSIDASNEETLNWLKNKNKIPTYIDLSLKQYDLIQKKKIELSTFDLLTWCNVGKVASFDFIGKNAVYLFPYREVPISEEKLKSLKKIDFKTEIEQPVFFDFTKTPLLDGMSKLSVLTGIKIHIPEKLKKKYKEAFKENIETESRGLSLKNSLKWILSDANFQYKIVDSKYILISAPFHKRVKYQSKIIKKYLLGNGETLVAFSINTHYDFEEFDSIAQIGDLDHNMKIMYRLGNFYYAKMSIDPSVKNKNEMTLILKGRFY
ncbi:MAG: hypothetical protein COA79_19025 [Planctomycetota bacterium]|nr:MAG: hypothetical protein COA79_19025 [Planctomycetota bacterium]